jgi:hypothetical protein
MVLGEQAGLWILAKKIQATNESPLISAKRGSGMRR